MKTTQTPFGTTTGRCGDVSYYNRQGDMVARLRKNDCFHSHSVDRSANSVLMSNPVTLWKCFPSGWTPAFRRDSASVTDYNLFIAHARCSWPIYLDRIESMKCVSILTPMAVSGGVLPPVTLQMTEDTMLTDIVIGDLEIDGDTTVGQWSEAVLANNLLFYNKDALLLYNGIQSMNPDLPQANIMATYLALDIHDEHRLTSLLPRRVTLLNAGGRLATGFGDGQGVAWVHLRPAAKGGEWMRSTQWMAVRNALAERYMTEEARDRAIYSYKRLRNAMK
mgnify:CR=1 FL=1